MILSIYEQVHLDNVSNVSSRRIIVSHVTQPGQTLQLVTPGHYGLAGGFTQSHVSHYCSSHLSPLAGWGTGPRVHTNTQGPAFHHQHRGREGVTESQQCRQHMSVV